MKTATHTTTTRETEYEFTGADIISALVETGRLPDTGNPAITFRVPGGGDWSNTTIDVDGDNPIHVRCHEVIES